MNYYQSVKMAVRRMTKMYGSAYVNQYTNHQIVCIDRWVRSQLLTVDEAALFEAVISNDPGCDEGMTPREFMDRMNRFAAGEVE